MQTLLLATTVLVYIALPLASGLCSPECYIGNNFHFTQEHFLHENGIKVSSERCTVKSFMFTAREPFGAISFFSLLSEISVLGINNENQERSCARMN